MVFIHLERENNSGRLSKHGWGLLSRAGFTLIEVMIAALILLIVLSGSISTIVYCILLNDTNQNTTTAINDAQFVLEQIKGLAYSEIAGYVPPGFSNLNNQTIAVNTSLGAKISEVTVNVGWDERQRQRSFQLSTRIAR
jgi:prepilin-type N-terminal cleavage/methylation domain-containing protein